jgi:hypothetical protein
MRMMDMCRQLVAWDYGYVLSIAGMESRNPGKSQKTWEKRAEFSYNNSEEGEDSEV